jgi:hypothetical protein
MAIIGNYLGRMPIVIQLLNDVIEDSKAFESRIIILRRQSLLSTFYVSTMKMRSILHRDCFRIVINTMNTYLI